MTDTNHGDSELRDKIEEILPYQDSYSEELLIDRIEILVNAALKAHTESLIARIDALTTNKTIVNWWVTTEFFAQGGKKVAGPFNSRATALKARTPLETKNGTTYAIDSTKRQAKQRTETVSIAQVRAALKDSDKEIP